MCGSPENSDYIMHVLAPSLINAQAEGGILVRMVSCGMAGMARVVG